MAACDSFLSVENENAPDQQQALSQPEDVENLIASSFFTWWKAAQNQQTDMTLSIAADEFADPYDNFSYGLQGYPREEWNNSPSFEGASVTERPWYGSYSALTSASEGVRAIENDGVTIGESGENTGRALAFGKFVQGLSQGYLALMFDQAFIVDETVQTSDLSQLELQPYGQVMEKAISELEKAAQIADTSSFTLPDDWINGNPMTNAELARLARSYAARYRAQVTRTPEERANVDWGRVSELVEQGIQEDFFITGTGTGLEEWSQFNLKFIANQPYGGRADNHTMGPADTSGNYQQWLNTPPRERETFTIYTADRRIVGPDSLTDPGKYFRHMFPLADAEYRQWRYDPLKQNGMKGPLAAMYVAEMDMLKAEALLRTDGSLEEVASLINKTRVENGELPPASAGDGVGSWDDPQEPAPSASLWAKLKHEKRLETYATSSGLEFFDDRGWNDLVQGTLLHYPIPGAELVTLGMENYTFGGGGEWSSDSGIQ